MQPMVYPLPEKLIAKDHTYGNIKIPVTIKETEETLTLRFGFSRSLIDAVKSFDGSRWNPEARAWTIHNSPRNRFQLSFLGGQNPYAHYDRPVIANFQPTRSLYKHQVELAVAALTYHYHIFAAEMGTGKTLAMIEVMEASGIKDWLWVGPRSALASVQLEMRKWKCRITPTFVTYEGLKKIVENWPKGQIAPQGVVFDESSRIKNPTAQRSVAARHLADSVRADWGYDGYVVEMSGSPAPKSPEDWWHQCEVAQPGYLREGNPKKFKYRLALIKMKDGGAGGKYPEIVTWFDDVNKCKTCGLLKDHAIHSPMARVLSEHADAHAWEPSVNEVAFLYKRMKGLVTVKFKRDCLDLPEKQYKIIELTPARSTLNAAKLIIAGAKNTISGMTLLRELSDGFQYVDKEVGTRKCPLCKGTREIMHKMLASPPMEEVDITEANFEEMSSRYPEEYFEVGDTYEVPIIPISTVKVEDVFTDELIPCPNCGGTGEVKSYVRQTQMVPCPKEDELINQLDLHEDVGRFVTFAGFSGSVDRICGVCAKYNWDVIKIDGRGAKGTGRMNGMPLVDMLELFQDKSRKISKICVVAHPASGGMGLTLTESPTEMYYSNDFNAESRIQSEDRIHRPGMDINLGATILDLIHLQSDMLVLNNLKAKRRLQDMSLGQFKESLTMTVDDRFA